MTVLLNKTLFYHEFRFGMKTSYIYKFLQKLKMWKSLKLVIKALVPILLRKKKRIVELTIF